MKYLELNSIFPDVCGNIIHPSSNCGDSVHLGHYNVIEADCFIGSYSLVGNCVVMRPNTMIGQYTKIGHFSAFEGDCSIGSHCLIGAQCHITSGVIVEDDVFMAPGFLGANDYRMCHNRHSVLRYEQDPFIIRRAARIGIGVFVFPGITIGENAIVGAGSLVTKDVADNTIVFGSPAVVRGMVPKKERL